VSNDERGLQDDEQLVTAQAAEDVLG